MDIKPSTWQFRRILVKRKNPVPGFDCYAAVYANHGNHLLVAAPTLELLNEQWNKLSDTPIILDMIQHVYIIEADK